MRFGGWLALAAAGIGIMLVTSLLQPVTWLEVTTDDGTRLACARVDEDTTITLLYTHSMYGGFVAEHYRLRDDGMLERQRMVTENAAAAEYYATDGRIRQTTAGYEVLAAPFVADHLPVRVDARGAHRLTIGGVTYPLYDQLRTSTRVTLAGERGARKDVPRACLDGGWTNVDADATFHQ